MKSLFTAIFICFVLILGYAAHVDAQAKKRQELMKIVQDAEHSLKVVQHNPHTHLATYNASN